ncbi:MDR family MFS transporter [Janthinobacterium sp. BJB304]|uniref:MDR family MFS transporter n=1 Tax=Janthinobacterium sp. BJB304 TaxID=1572871 RepID=UPI00211F036A|nr:MDR family MFS transporter [Janthinobacterium sp. BJB304]
MSGHDRAAGADKDAVKPVTEREVRAIYLGLMAVLGLGALDQSIVATALPRIVDDLGGMAHLSWVVTAYVLASTATMPLYGKLADQYGRRPMIFTALLTFLLGSVLCGLAQNMTELIIFRAIQGLGAGGFMPLAQIIIGDIVPPAERGKRQGMVPVVFAVTSVLGPVLGGVITDALSWHWIFYVNLPIGAVAFVIIARAMRKPAENRTFNIASLVMAMTFMGLMGASVFFPLFFQLVMGTSPAESGVMTVAMMVGLVASSMFNGRVLSRSGKYKMVQVAGLAVALLAFAVLAWAMETSRGYWIIEPAIFFLGTGLGLVMPNMTIAVQNALPLARRGVGTAMLAFFRSLGGLLGVTASGAILAHQLHKHGVEAVSALGAQAAVQTVEVYRHAIASVFGAGAVLLLAGLVALLFLPELPLEGHPATLKPKTDQ